MTSRNKLAWSKDPVQAQERDDMIKNTKALVIGLDHIGQMVLSGLFGLGVGEIHYSDPGIIERDYKGFLVYKDESIGKSKAEQIAHSLDELNPQINHRGLASEFYSGIDNHFSPDFIFECSNVPLQKERVAKHAQRNGSVIFSLSSNNSRGIINVHNPKGSRYNLENIVHEEFDSQHQGGIASSIIAGIAVETMRKYIFKYSPNEICLSNNQSVIYNLLSRTRRDEVDDFILPSYFRDKRVLILGAGAIGNFVGLNAAYIGFGEIDIIDMDIIKSHNLERQPAFHGRVGEKKAKVLADRIRQIDSKITVNAIEGKIGSIDRVKDSGWLGELYANDLVIYQSQYPTVKLPDFETYIGHHFLRNRNEPFDSISITEDMLLSRNYDILFGCFDNKYARIWANNFAVKNKIIYVDGGSSPTAGKVTKYNPGKSPCIDCQNSLKTYQMEPISCGDQPNPSVIVPNMIIGASMIGEGIRLMYDNSQGASPFFYDSNSNQIFGLLKPKQMTGHC